MNTLIYTSNLSIDHRIETRFGEGKGPIFLSGLNCKGDEDSLLDCPLFGNPVEFLSLSHSTDIGVHCAGTTNNSAVPLYLIVCLSHPSSPSISSPMFRIS